MILVSSIFPQEGSQKDTCGTNTIFSKKTLSVAGVSLIYVSGVWDAYHMWWKGDHQPFHFYKTPYGLFNDPSTLGIDKAGHFFTSYFLYRVQKNIFLWGGYNKDFSANLSAILSCSFAVLIEIGDSFTYYGFDYEDMLFNLAGVGYGMLQDKFEFLENFKIKWSFIPSTLKPFPPSFSEHYPDQIYWLAVNIHNLFGRSFCEFWPEYIQPAFGFSISGGEKRHREWMVGLDFDLKSIIGHTENDWDYLVNSVNMFHIPAPGIKFSKFTKPEPKLFLTK